MPLSTKRMIFFLVAYLLVRNTWKAINLAYHWSCIKNKEDNSPTFFSLLCAAVHF